MPLNTTSDRFPWSAVLFAAAGLLNVGLVVALSVALSGGFESHARAGQVERAVSGIDAQAEKLAKALAAVGRDPAAIAREASHLAPDGAEYEVAIDLGGKPRVVAAHERALIGQPPEGALLEALRGQAPLGAFEGEAAEGGSRYTAYQVVSLPPAPAATARPTPSVAPTPRRVRKTFIKEVPVPAGTHAIRPGDTLYQIAREYYQDQGMFLAIYEANKAAIGADRSNLPKGAVLTLPPGVRRVEETRMVEEVPTPAPTPVATPTPAAVRGVALRLTVPVEAAPAPQPWDAAKQQLVGGAAGLTAALWLAGGFLLRRHRRRGQKEQREALLHELSRRLEPQGPALDPAAFRSAWQLELTTAVLGGGEAGGSFADVRALSETHLGVLVGDATGTNPSATLSRGLTAALWRALASERELPGRTLVALNRILADYVPQGEHVTAFYARLDLMSGAVLFASAAHAGAYWLRPSGECVLLGGRGVPLAVGHELFAARLAEGTARLKEGESLWAFTEGLLKVENAEGEPFGLARLEACLKESAGLAAEKQVAALQSAVRAFAGRRRWTDDAAVACLRLSPRANAPSRQRAGVQSDRT